MRRKGQFLEMKIERGKNIGQKKPLHITEKRLYVLLILKLSVNG